MKLRRSPLPERLRVSGQSPSCVPQDTEFPSNWASGPGFYLRQKNSSPQRAGTTRAQSALMEDSAPGCVVGYPQVAAAKRGGENQSAGWFSTSALAQGTVLAAASAFKREFFDSRRTGRESSRDCALRSASGSPGCALGTPGRRPHRCGLRAGFRLLLVGACGAFCGSCLHFVSRRFCPFLRLFPPND